VSFFGLTGGEFSIVAFVTVMVVSARYWPAFGERIAVRLSGAAPDPVAGQKAADEVPPRE
jgi:hypothetical protein